MDIELKKSRLRDETAKRLEAMSDDDRVAESQSVQHKIQEALPDDVMTVCAFSTLAQEVNIQPLLHEFIKEGKKLFLPRMEDDRIVFRLCEDLSALVIGSYGVPEPHEDAEVLTSDGEIIALIPGVAFDLEGGRLGRGKGGYDIWIREQRKKNEKTRFLGVCFQCQIVPEIPIEEHDELVDAVITSSGNKM